MIIVHLFKAGYGDTILVTVKPDDQILPEVNILIDCGFNFQSEVKPVLEKMHTEGKKLDRFIITHFDKDHIDGAYKFISENGANSSSNIIQIDQVWLNTFRHLQFSRKSATSIDKNDKNKLSALMSEYEVEDRDKEGEIGAWQATKLGSLLLKFDYQWNSDFNHNAVCVEHKNIVEVGKDTVLAMLSPDYKKLEKIEKSFLDDLGKHNIKVSEDALFDDAFELFCIAEEEASGVHSEGTIASNNYKLAKENIKELSANLFFGKDSTPGNGSSIAFILKHADKQILFLADAQMDVVIQQLKKLYPDPTKYPIIFDAIKVSHHGSLKNCHPDLLAIVDSPKFLFSTDGSHPAHKHPDIETIALIISRPLPFALKCRELIFNYALSHLTELENVDLKKTFSYTTSISQEIKIG